MLLFKLWCLLIFECNILAQSVLLFKGDRVWLHFVAKKHFNVRVWKIVLFINVRRPDHPCDCFKKIFFRVFFRTTQFFLQIRENVPINSFFFGLWQQVNYTFFVTNVPDIVLLGDRSGHRLPRYLFSFTLSFPI